MKLLFQNVQTSSGDRAFFFVQLVPGGSFSEVKRPGRVADHSTPSSTEVRNEWSCSPLPQYIRLHGVVKVKFTLEQATKAQRGNIGIALLFL